MWYQDWNCERGPEPSAARVTSLSGSIVPSTAGVSVKDMAVGEDWVSARIGKLEESCGLEPRGMGFREQERDSHVEERGNGGAFRTVSGPCLDPVWRDRRPASGSVRLSSHRAQTRSIWGKWFRLGEMMPGWRLSGATQAA